MELKIPKDYFDNPVPPEIYLCTTGKKIINELPAYERSLVGKWNAYSELNLSIDRTYVDVLTGETKVHPTFDKAEGLRMVYVKDIGYFLIQDPDYTAADNDVKTLTCFSSEYATGSKYLEEFRINTGDVDAKEVIYAEKHNLKYDPNNPYVKASGAFDPYKRYYEQTYSDTDSYTYTETQVVDSEDYNNRIDRLFVRSYKNVQFYDANTPELSLLHLIFEKIPEWSIGDVDAKLWHKERKFDEERIAVYDFLMNNVSDTFDCVVEWDTITNCVNFYEEAEDGITEDNNVQTRFNTDVFISRDNLANEINIKYSSDDIKTKLKVSGSDGLDIRETNLGKNYLINLDYYHDDEWMEQDLKEAYDDYLNAIADNSEAYSDATQDWVSAYQSYSDLMHAVPADAGVVLVGDKFEKLYCVYEPMDTAFLSQTVTDADKDTLTVDNLYTLDNHTEAIDKSKLKDKAIFCVQGYRFTYVKKNNNFKCIEKMSAYSERALVGTEDKPQTGKLAQYLVNEDTDSTKKDNILLKLKNASSDVATIRIYNDGEKDKPNYLIQVVITKASTGIDEAPIERTISQWVNGTLTAENLKLEDYTITYIGTMGAYFVLVKDETQEATLEEYGVNLLKEKHDTYTTIFQTQTEAMFSKDKHQCIVQNEQPEGNYEKGTRWLDTNSSPVVLKEYNGTTWQNIEADVSEDEQKDYKNYQRYIDNYNKMVAVQEMLVKKEKEANYLLNGYKVENNSIDISQYRPDPSNNNELYLNGISLLTRMEQVAKDYFGNTVSKIDFDATLPLYTFTTSVNPKKEFAVYLIGTEPYVAYKDSQGVHQSRRNYISKITDFETFFTKDQWTRLSWFIREDEFSDDNFLLTGYESEEERLKICEELMDAAAKELQSLAQPNWEFSMTMANILALPEFQPLIHQFKLGNFVRVYVRDNYIKRARLLEVNLNFDDFSDFSCTFGNLITTKSEIDKHADLLKQAVTAGKTVATAAGDWQMAADKANKIEEEIMNGLANATLEMGRASNQAIKYGANGIWCRKVKDGRNNDEDPDSYENEQIRIINNKILYSNDGFKTSKSAFGSFTYDGKTYNGLLAEAVIGGLVQGAQIRGGYLEIGGDGGKFIVNEDGSVQILGPDQAPIYAAAGDVGVLQQALTYQTKIIYEGSTVFSSTNDSCILSCEIYRLNDATGQYDNITAQLKDKATFEWIRDPSPWTPRITPTTDITLEFNQIKITHEDVKKNAQFSCKVHFDDENLTS